MNIYTYSTILVIHYDRETFFDTKICVHPSDNSVEFLYTGLFRLEFR